MFYEFSQHKLAYFILTCLLTMHVVLFLLVWPDKNAQRILAGTLALSYFCWGVFAHVKAQHITKKIVREYLFAAILAGMILFLLTL